MDKRKVKTYRDRLLGRRPLHACLDHRVVFAEGRAESPSVSKAHRERSAEEAEHVSRQDRGVVNEPGSARFRNQLHSDSERCERSRPVAPVHSEPVRPDPFEGLLLPLQLDAVAREPEPFACVGPRRRVGQADRRQARIAVKAIGVGCERPQLFRGRPQPPLPSVMKVGVVHGIE